MNVKKNNQRQTEDRQEKTDNKISAVAEVGDRLVTIDMGQKWGRDCCAPFCGENWVAV